MSERRVKYRDIDGHPGYRVGNDGSVWSKWTRESFGRGGGTGSRPVIGKKWKQLRVAKQRSGWAVTLCNYGVRKTLGIHRLVLAAFVGPCPKGMEGCHADGDSSNNNLSNLRWDTHANNMLDMVRHGTVSRGERHPRSKLTREQKLEIRDRYAAGGILQRELGKQYGIHPAHVCRLISKTRN